MLTLKERLLQRVHMGQRMLGSILPVPSHHKGDLQPKRHSQGYVLPVHSPSNGLGQHYQREGNGLQVGCGQHQPVLRLPAALQ